MFPTRSLWWYIKQCVLICCLPHRSWNKAPSTLLAARSLATVMLQSLLNNVENTPVCALSWGIPIYWALVVADLTSTVNRLWFIPAWLVIQLCQMSCTKQQSGPCASPSAIWPRIGFCGRMCDVHESRFERQKSWVTVGNELGVSVSLSQFVFFFTHWPHSCHLFLFSPNSPAFCPVQQCETPFLTYLIILWLHISTTPALQSLLTRRT